MSVPFMRVKDLRVGDLLLRSKTESFTIADISAKQNLAVTWIHVEGQSTVTEMSVFTLSAPLTFIDCVVRDGEVVWTKVAVNDGHVQMTPKWE